MSLCLIGLQCVCFIRTTFDWLEICCSQSNDRNISPVVIQFLKQNTSFIVILAHTDPCYKWCNGVNGQFLWCYFVTIWFTHLFVVSHLIIMPNKHLPFIIDSQINLIKLSYHTGIVSRDWRYKFCLQTCQAKTLWLYLNK